MLARLVRLAALALAAGLLCWDAAADAVADVQQQACATMPLVDGVVDAAVRDPTVAGQPRAADAVLMAPHFPPSFCEEVIAVAETVASTAGGWATDRHHLHKTTDMSVWESETLSGLLAAPIRGIETRINELYKAAFAQGAGPDLSFTDVFVVKYSEDAQRSLALHEDSSVVTFQVLLNSRREFTGGGTIFSEMGCTLSPDQGTLVMFPGHLQHGGLAIEAGTRYLLVGFSQHATAAQDGARRLGRRLGDNDISQTANVLHGAPFTVVCCSRGVAPWIHTGQKTLHAEVRMDACTGDEQGAAGATAGLQGQFSLMTKTQAPGDASAGTNRVGLVWLVRDCPQPRPRGEQQQQTGGDGSSSGGSPNSARSEAGSRSFSARDLDGRGGARRGCNKARQAVSLELALPPGFWGRHDVILFGFPPDHDFASWKLKPAAKHRNHTFVAWHA